MTSKILADFGPFLADNHFTPIAGSEKFNSVGQCWRLAPEFGEGFYWVYAQKDLYDIKIHDFYFHEDFLWILICHRV